MVSGWKNVGWLLGVKRHKLGHLSNRFICNEFILLKFVPYFTHSRFANSSTVAFVGLPSSNRWFYEFWLTACFCLTDMAVGSCCFTS